MKSYVELSIDGLTLDQAVARYIVERDAPGRLVNFAPRIFDAAVERFGEDVWYRALGIGRDFTR